MKRNTKYVAHDGYQIAMYPNEVMNITQSINGGFSHQGVNALDDAQQDTGISKGFAPCDMKCVAVDYTAGHGNAIWWESINKVHTLKYGLTKIFMMVIHDNTANAYPGLVVKQGDQLFEEGTAGFATGNHSHLEFGVGNYRGQYVMNGYGVWMMPGNVDPSDVLFADDTRIINGGGLIWEKIPASLKKKAEPVKINLISEHHIAVVKPEHTINIRKDSPTGTVVRKAPAGTRIEYTEKVVEGFDHRYISWKEGSTRLFMACSADQTRNDMWITIEDLPTSKEPKKELIGIDISGHQTNVNYAEAAKHIDFAILRASYGTIEDSMFRTHTAGLKKAGVEITGLYCFDYSLDDAFAAEEAKTLVRLAKAIGLPKTAVLWFDCEYDSVNYAADPKRNQTGSFNYDAATVQRRTNIFMEEVKKSGYQYGYYFNLDWHKNRYKGFKPIAGAKTWFARYDCPNPEVDADILQYTSSGKVPGFNGLIDMNKMTVNSTTEKPKNETVNGIELIKEDGCFIVGNHEINVREGDPVTGKVVRTAKNHNLIRYTEKCVSKNHRHVSWVVDGKRYFIAINDSPKQGQAMWGEIITDVILPEIENKKYFWHESKGGENPYPCGICTWLSFGLMYQSTGKRPVIGWEPSKNYDEKDWAFQLVDKIAARDKSYMVSEKPVPNCVASTRATEGGSHTFFVTNVHPDGRIDYWEANMNNHSEDNPHEADVYYRRNRTLKQASQGYYLKFAVPRPKTQWVDGVLKVGDTVKSRSCSIAVYPGTNSAIKDNCVYVPELGGLIPLSDVSEAADTKDGKCDNYLANPNARVYLDEGKVEAINVQLNLAKVRGYWVNAEPLLIKK